MATTRILDTAALLAWPPPRLAGGLCAASQQAELERLSRDRALLVDTADLQWRMPSADELNEARAVAGRTGDLPRLSQVDLDVLALALAARPEAELVTDDYRLQNCATAAGLAWSAVATKGVARRWSWELQCTGCGRTRAVNERDGQDPADCDVCGSPQRLRKQRR